MDVKPNTVGPSVKDAMARASTIRDLRVKLTFQQSIADAANTDKTRARSKMVSDAKQ